MREIFVNYRREDSSDSAGRLCGELTEQFGRDAVFRDVATLAPGSDFAETIRATIPQAKVVLVVIGKQWLRILRRRIDDPGDLLPTEIETALTHRDRLLVIPVLVQRATMPKASQLPPSLQALCTVNAIELDDDPRWEFDMRRLVGVIETRVPRLPSAPPLAETAVIEVPPPQASGPVAAASAPEIERRKRGWAQPAAVRAAAVAAALLVGALVVLGSGGGSPESKIIGSNVSSSVPELVTTAPPTSEPVSTTIASHPGTTRGPSGPPVTLRPGGGQTPGPVTTSPATTARRTTPSTTTTTPAPPIVAPGQLAVTPQSGGPGTVINLSAGACTRPAGWSGGEIYYGLSGAGTDAATGKRWWTAPEPWKGQLTVPALPSGEYSVWANCYAWDDSASRWERFYLYQPITFRVP